MITVSDYSRKKLVEYLEDGLKVLIRFDRPYHGVGDCAFFMPLYAHLKKTYPNVQFSFVSHHAQAYFNDNYDQYATYDYCFYIILPEFDMHGDTKHMSKPEICCVKELGIPFDESLECVWQPKHKPTSRFIGVSFCCTSDPRTNVPEGVAKLVWEGIRYHGMIPIEVQFDHHAARPENKKYAFVDCTCRGTTPSIEAMLGVLGACKGFAGVNTGSLVLAGCMSPETTLHLNTGKSYTHYKRINPLFELMANDAGRFDLEEFMRWVRCVRDDKPYTQ